MHSIKIYFLPKGGGTLSTGCQILWGPGRRHFIPEMAIEHFLHVVFIGGMKTFGIKSKQIRKITGF